MSRETILHRAAYLNRIDIIPFILKEWPDSVQVKNKRVETPYDVAESRNNSEAMALLKQVTENNIGFLSCLRHNSENLSTIFLKRSQNDSSPSEMIMVSIKSYSSKCFVP